MATFTLTPPSYGKVVGRFIVAIGDGIDSDVYPDGAPASGTIVFTPSVKKVLIAAGSPDPVTLELQPVTATLDSSGYLTFNGQQGVWLVATDDGNTNPSGFTWSVQCNITYSGGVIDTSKFDISVPTSSTSDSSTWTDLTKVSPIPSSSGTFITQGVRGLAGPATSLTIGTVTTGSAAASITGTAPNQVLNLTLPAGGSSGTVQKVNGVSPDGAGNVPLTPANIGAYQKPGTGIPQTDLATAVQGLLTNAVPNTRNVNGRPLSTDVTTASADITDSTVTGRSVITAADQQSARVAIDAWRVILLGPTDPLPSNPGGNTLVVRTS